MSQKIISFIVETDTKLSKEQLDAICEFTKDSLHAQIGINRVFTANHEDWQPIPMIVPQFCIDTETVILRVQEIEREVLYLPENEYVGSAWYEERKVRLSEIARLCSADASGRTVADCAYMSRIIEHTQRIIKIIGQRLHDLDSGNGRQPVDVTIR